MVKGDQCMVDVNQDAGLDQKLLDFPQVPKGDLEGKLQLPKNKIPAHLNSFRL